MKILIKVILCIMLCSSCSLLKPQEYVWDYFKFEEHPLAFPVPSTKSWEREIGNPCGRVECRYIAKDHELGVELHLVEYKDFPDSPKLILDRVLKRYSARNDKQTKWRGKALGKDGQIVLEQVATQVLWAGRPWNILAKSWIYDNANHVVLLLYKGRLNEGRLKLFSKMIELVDVPVSKLLL